jgi:hypothetical protein
VKEHSDGVGDCEFCEAQDVPVIDTVNMANPFHNLLAMYVVADSYESGETLLNLVQWEWDVFAEDLSEDMQAALLEDIVNSDWDDDDGVPTLDVRELYMSKSSGWLHQTHTDNWAQFCYEVRDDPSAAIPFDEFIAEELGESEERLSAGMALYRARLGFETDDNEERVPWSGNDIGAPPPEKASVGRANAEGQVVLYVADQEKTAISEVRPALGFYVSVGTLKLKRDCRVLDLTKDLPELNPFIRESLGWHVEIRSLLDSLGEDMSRPLERADDKKLYVPCQRLADYIRRNYYDGIRYPSALNPGGSSIVFFDPEIAEVVNAKLVKITEVKVEYEPDEEPRLANRLNSPGDPTHHDCEPDSPLNR